MSGGVVSELVTSKFETYGKWFIVFRTDISAIKKYASLNIEGLISTIFGPTGMSVVLGILYLKFASSSAVEICPVIEHRRLIDALGYRKPATMFHEKIQIIIMCVMHFCGQSGNFIVHVFLNFHFRTCFGIVSYIR